MRRGDLTKVNRRGKCIVLHVAHVVILLPHLTFIHRVKKFQPWLLRYCGRLRVISILNSYLNLNLHVCSIDQADSCILDGIFFHGIVYIAYIYRSQCINLSKLVIIIQLTRLPALDLVDCVLPVSCVLLLVSSDLVTVHCRSLLLGCHPSQC